MTKPKCGKWPYDFTIVAGDIILNSRGSVEAQGLICAALEDACAAGRASRDNLREALERSRMAIDDWLHSYAPEFCDEDSVAQTRSRISEKGTIGYIADVQEQNYETLSADDEAGK